MGIIGIIGIIGGILTIIAFFNVIIKLLFSGNIEFFKIINEFKKKLPPSYKKAEIITNNNKMFSEMDLSVMNTKLDDIELDKFAKELEDFDYGRIYFKKKGIKKYTRNIQRIIRTTDDIKFKIGMLQKLIDNEERKKPYLINHKVARYIKF